MKSNDELYKDAVEAIRDLFGDTSVSATITKENLQTIKDEIDIMLDSLDGQCPPV